MKKVLLAILIGAMPLLAVDVPEDVAKGQQYYAKRLKVACGFDGGKMAKKHTQEEWLKIHQDGSLLKVISEYCPNATELPFTLEKYVYAFLNHYAKGTGIKPS
jgi:hypothetical protein